MKKMFEGKQLLIIFSILLGILLSFQMKQNIDDYTLVTLNSIQGMKNEVNNNKEEIANIKELIEKRRQELSNYKDTIENKGSIRDILNEELDSIMLVAGMTDVQGPGVYIVLEDSDKEYVYGEDLNDYIIHNIDIAHIINDLKAADAEAISINGERVLAHSEIICDGPILTINGEVVAAPFIVKAIGDPNTLSAAINAPNAYGYWLKETFGIKIETHMSDNIKIPKYTGNPTFKYVKTKQEEGE